MVMTRKGKYCVSRPFSPPFQEPIMPAHAPLTPTQIELAWWLAGNPVRMTYAQLGAAPQAVDLMFLINIGAVASKPVYVAQNPAETIVELTRTDQPV